MANSGCKAWACSLAGLSSSYGHRAETTPRTSSLAAMPTANKPTNTSKHFSAAEIAAAKAGADSVPAQPKKDWSKGTVTQGGGVAATIAALRRTRGPNKKPTKEQVAIRLDPEVLG